MLSVEKYGGDYLKDVTDMKKIARHISRKYDYDNKLVVVVAAMHSIAEGIMESASKRKENIEQDELDGLFASGEKQTASLMAIALQQEGVPAMAIADLRGYSLSDEDVKNGNVEINMEPVIDVLEQGQVAVVAGFQGIGDFHLFEKKGRYGAAATAVVIAAGLGGSCNLFGNTKGLYRVVPPIDENKNVIKEISYEEAMEMVLTGYSDLESRALELGKQLGVKIYVGPALTDDESGGTYIMDKTMVVQEGEVTGISVSDDIVVYTIEGIPNKWPVVAEIFSFLEELGINIDIITQQYVETGKSIISFSCSTDKAEKIEMAFRKHPKMRRLKLSKKEDLTLVSVIGVGMASHAGVASKTFLALAKEKIPNYNTTTSEISISVTVDSANRNKAIVALSEAFKL